MDAHLAACAACRAVSLRLRTALDAWREAGPAPAPVHVLADLLEAQASTAARHGGRVFRLRPVFVTAALVVLAGIFASGFWFGRTSAPAPAPATAEAGAPAPRPLPQRPAIEFRAEPALMTGFAVVAEAGVAAEPAGTSNRDSL